ncbi:MAG: sterol desaturase family protein, partial [Nannocystaceae bacterium]
MYTRAAVHAIAYSIPVFSLLIGLELWLAHRRGRKLFRFGDAVSNISCGIGQQTVGLFVAAATLALYVWVYQHRVWEFDIRSPWTWVLAMLWVDFAYYWWHRMSHEVNIFWAVHIVHHQSEDYNLSVALRQAYISGPTAIAFYLPLALVGVPPEAWALSHALNLLYQFWIHTKLIDKMPRFGKVFNTPSHHRVHHGTQPQYLDRNHAGMLIIWDKIFGSFEPELEPPIYG